MQPHLFCFGLGYTAAVLGRRLMAEGWRVSGTTRTAGKAAALAKDGFAVHLFDTEQPHVDLQTAFADATHMLISTPPERGGDPTLTDHGAALGKIVPGLRWLGYLSTTGVYGDHGGGWVDESTSLTPMSDRAIRRYRAELAWENFAQDWDAPLHIFRLPGIYGPGRSAIDALKAGTARRIDKPGQVFSRIHVEDLATALAASMSKPDPGAVYNICDDEPAPQHEVIAYAANLLGMAPPPLEPYDEAAKTMSAMAQSFYTESKRVRNETMKRALGVRLRYPSYREGLRALFTAT